MKMTLESALNYANHLEQQIKEIRRRSIELEKEIKDLKKALNVYQNHLGIKETP